MFRGNVSLTIGTVYKFSWSQYAVPSLLLKNVMHVCYVIIIIIIIKDIYIAQVRKGHKCATSAEMAVWLCGVWFIALVHSIFALS